MALPKWITPAGQLGIVPELEYYQFNLDAFDASGGLLVFSKVSGRLPLGIQVVSPTEFTLNTSGNITAFTGSYISQYSSGANATVVLNDTVSGTRVTVRYVNQIEFDTFGNLTVDGANVSVKPTSIIPPSPARLQGIPVSDSVTDQNAVYTFTIRAQNAWTGNIADRTFNLTITNVSPPIISKPTRNSFLGIYLDGGEVNTQLEVIEFLPSAQLTWSIKSGDLPPGLSLSTDGVLSGYLIPIPSTAPGTTPNWDNSAWSFLGWDFSLRAISKRFTFTVQVTDGLNSDLSTYSLDVFPRSSLTSDNDELSVDTTVLGTGLPLTIDYGNKHNPIITTTQDELPPVREGSYFSFELTSIDLDGDVVNYSVPALIQGTFDEQVFSNVSPSYPYAAEKINNGYLYSGIFPSTLDVIDINAKTSSSTIDSTAGEYLPGDVVKLLDQNNVWRESTIGTEAIIRITGNSIIQASPGQYITQDSSLANAEILSVSNTVGTITLGGEIFSGNLNTVLPTFVISFNGNITANVGQFITQSSSGANARIINTFRYITLTGANIATQTFNVGDYITQNGSTGNARVVERVVGIPGNAVVGSAANSSLVYVDFLSGSFANVGVVGNIRLNGANVNAVPSTIFSGNTSVVSVLYNTGRFVNGSGNIAVNGIARSVIPTNSVKDPQQITLSANVGDFITQTGYSGNATVTANVRDAVSIPVIFTQGIFNELGGNVRINGTDTGVWIASSSNVVKNYSATVSVGQYISQTSSNANAIVTGNVISGSLIPVRFLGNTFLSGRNSGNISIGGQLVRAFTSSVVANTEFTIDYISNTFDFNRNNLSTAVPKIAGTEVPYANITALIAVGADYGAVSTEGTVGFDEAKFDQGSLALPAGLTLDTNSGWITGILPSQTINRVDYEFEILAFKESDPTYQDSQLYTLTVLGDLNNRIDWVTPSDLGTIETGKVSDLFIFATSPLGKTLFYELAADSYHRLPQGLQLSLTGLITGRVSFELFGLDNNLTTIDGGNTTFDGTFRFTVSARDINNTIATGTANRTFTLKVVQTNLVPYENLYIKALPTRAQRDSFNTLVNDQSIFPLDKIYRIEDPWFGLAKDIRSLFLPGLNPSTLAEYVQAAGLNHFNKRFLFNGIKTAQVLDSNFNVKYEVVYLQLDSANDIETANFIHNDEKGPPDVLNLSSVITNPYYDLNGNSYFVAYPNSTQNMESRMISQIGYENKGVLPDWMTSRQRDGRQLGFVHAVVLAYTKPDESDLIAYRLRERNFNFNSIDFTVDRYHLDNILTTNFDVTANAFITSSETTFDRYPPLPSERNYIATVDYAISTPYDQVHLHTVSDIRALGGLDGVKNFKDGDTLVFGLQEFRINQNTAPQYNDGWSDVLELWDRDPWAQNPDTSDSDTLTPFDPTLTPPNLGPYDFTPGEKWDQAQYVPGFDENDLDPAIPNKRIGVWQVNIDAEDIVTLTFIQEVNYNDAIFVRNGFTYGGRNIYYDSIVKEGFSVPSYSIVPQTIRTTYTTFDGNGTRFLVNRDIYNVPGQGDKYIKFTNTGVFT